MRRGLQWKMALMYLMLVLVAMELTGFYLLQSLERYYLGNFSQTLYTQAQIFAGSLQRYLGPKPDPSGLQNLAQEWSGLFGAEVAVLSPDGVVIAAPGGRPEWQGNRLTTDEITRAIAGSRGERVGRDPDTGERRLYLAVPIQGRPGQQVQAAEPITGIVYLSASLENEYRTLADIRKYVLYATGIALLVTAVLGVALARTITDPIQELTSRAARMAAGDFNQSIQIQASDEIGQLGSTFNYMTQRLKETLGEISDEKRKVEAILTHMADGLVAVDRQDQVMLMNPAAAAMLGMDREKTLGTRATAWLRELGLDEAMSRVLRHGETISERVTLPQEPPRVVRADIAPLPSDRSANAGAVIVMHDVTEQENLDRMRREFVANVSHELRTPITTVKSYLETLLDGASADPSVLQRFLRVAAGEADRMSRLVADLLRLAQMDSGQVVWRFAPTSLPGLTADVLAALAVQAGQRQVTLERQWPEDLPKAWADSDRLQQVLTNVLNNAINYTPAGGRVTVSIARQGDFLGVRVRDTGIGIPARDLPHIFERFYRVDKARSREMGGTGLGLAIAREIVAAHGGEISLSSEVGKGTEVRFTIPVVPERGEAA